MSEPRNSRKLVGNDELLKRYAAQDLTPEVARKLEALLAKNPKLKARLTDIVHGSKDTNVAPKRAAPTPKTNPTRKVAPETSSEGGPSEDLPTFPDYVEVRKLESENRGDVYLARNVPLDRLEVLKVFPLGLDSDAAFRQKCEEEIKQVCKLSHPCIVTGYRTFPLDDSIVFAMEHVDGIRLDDFIAPQEPISISLVCTIAEQVVIGLQHAFTRNLVHRAIKPSNLMLLLHDGEVQVKILNFGMANIHSESKSDALSQFGSIPGTPEYISPEQILGGSNIDIRADIYSLGCTLYHLLTGRPPFQGTAGEILVAQVQSNPEPIESFQSNVPAELRETIVRMMAKSPADRYQTPDEVLQAIRRLKSENGSWGTSVAQSTFTGHAEEALSTAQHGVVLPGTSGRSTSSRGTIQPRTRKRVRHRPMWLYATLGILAVGFSLAFAFSWNGPSEDGLLILNGLPPDAVVMIDGDRVTMAGHRDAPSHSIPLKPGQRQLSVQLNEETILEENVLISRGHTKSITIAAKQAPSLVADRTPTSTNADTPADPKSDTQPSQLLAGNQGVITKQAVTASPESHWWIDESRQELVQDSVGTDAHYLIFGDSKWTDLIMTFEASRPEGKLHSGPFGLIYNAANDHIFNEWQYGRLENGAFTFLSFVSYGTSSPIPGTGTLRTDPVEPRRWYKMSIKIEGDNVECSVDGKLLYQYIENNPLRGRVGLLSRFCPSRFRSISVTAIDGTPLWSGLPVPPAMDHNRPSDLVALFNGKDLSGWQANNDPSASWTIENAALKGETQSRNLASNTQLPPGSLQTIRDDFSELQLKLQAKVSQDADSSIVFRRGPTDFLQVGLSLQNNTLGHCFFGKLNSGAPQPLGKVRAHTTPVQPDEWFDVDIRVRESSFNIFVNEQMICDGNYTSDASSGPILFIQSSAQPSETWLRNIQVRE